MCSAWQDIPVRPLPIGAGVDMMNLYTAGTDLVRSELTALGPHGPYRLTVDHGRGSIVEYFQSLRVALAREAELEQLLMSARGARGAQKGVAA